MSKVYEIKVLKFDDYNLKSIGKAVEWMRVDVRLARSSKFLQLTSGCKHLWIWLLCEAGQTKTRVVHVHPKFILSEAHVTKKGLESALNVLSGLGWIQVLRTPYERTIRTNERDDTNVPVGSEEKQKPKTKPAAAAVAKAPGNAGVLVAFYCDLWKVRYKTEKSPPILPHHAKALKGLLEQAGKERAEKLVQAYLSMPDSWFLTKSHDIPTLMGNLNKVSQFVDTGKMLSKSEITQVDKAVSNSNTLNALRRGEV